MKNNSSIRTIGTRTKTLMMKMRRWCQLARWTTLGLAFVALAAGPASAGVLPWIKGQTFHVNATPEHNYEMDLYFSWQDTAGNFIVEATHAGKPKVIGTGKITEVNPLSYAIAFNYSLNATWKYSYTGSIRQWGGPAPGTDAKWFMAGSFTIDMQTIYGSTKVGPRPFCANASYWPLPN